MEKKHKIIVITSLSISLIALCIIFIFYGCLTCASKQDADQAVSYYKRDDSYINISAKISDVKQIGDYYRVYLQYDEQIADLKFAEYFELIPSNVSELQKNEFNIAADDKTYVFTVGRKTLHNGPMPLITHPVVAIRESDQDGKVFLSYETGKSNLVSYLQSKK